MKSTTSGFTIVEVIVAIIILGIGVLGIVGTSAMVSRMIGHGKRSTYASQVLSRRIETLRQAALVTTTPCSGLSSGSQSYPGRISETWTISGAGRTRHAVTIVTYPTATGMTADTVSTVVGCF